MHLKTILNRVEKHKSFVYGKVVWAEVDGREGLEVSVEPRANGRAICSGCERPRPGYDRLPARRFEFVPLWNIAVFLVYSMRRVDCPTCGVKVERVPWGNGQCGQTKSYQWFLARWARRLSWREVAGVFHTSWDTVFRSVRQSVLWGLIHRDLEGVEAVGVDEVQWRRGHTYLTLVYQIDAGSRRLLYVAPDRTEASLRGCFHTLDGSALRYVCSDMWRPYLNVLAEEAGGAVHVLDRFHIVKQMHEAIDEVRAGEARQLVADGYEPVLKHSRWCLLKPPERLTERQTAKLSELLKYNLKSVRAYLLVRDFQRFWEYRSPYWARRFLREWCTRTMRSRIEPLQKVARMLRRHEELILNWFRAKGTISAGIVEGFNNKVKLTTRKSYGFRTYEALRTALFHTLGALPEPEFTHEFC